MAKHFKIKTSMMKKIKYFCGTKKKIAILLESSGQSGKCSSCCTVFIMHDSINTDCFQYYVHFITTDAALALFAVVTYFFIC